MIPALELPILHITLPFAIAMPTGIVDWSDSGALFVWFLLMALVGSILGLLHERARGGPHFPANGRMLDEDLDRAA